MSIDELTLLVISVQKQQEDAFNCLYEYSYPLIRNYALYLGANHVEADDIAQDSILKIHCNIHKLKNPICYKKWMYRVVYSCFYAFKRRRKEVLLEGEEFHIAETRSYMIPESYLEESDLNEQLYVALSPLRKHLQEVLVLRYLEELSEKEIAQVTHLPRGTVKSRLFYARKQLQSQC